MNVLSNIKFNIISKDCFYCVTDGFDLSITDHTYCYIPSMLFR